MLAFLLLWYWSPPISAATLTVPMYEKVWTVEEMKSLATGKAKAHHLNVEHFLKVIECESGWNPTIIGDGGLSHGLAQLYYPTRDWGIATSSAYEPEMALEIMATAWERNRASKWTCWRTYYGASLATPSTQPSLPY